MVVKGNETSRTSPFRSASTLEPSDPANFPKFQQSKLSVWILIGGKDSNLESDCATQTFQKNSTFYLRPSEVPAHWILQSLPTFQNVRVCIIENYVGFPHT